MASKTVTPLHVKALYALVALLLGLVLFLGGLLWKQTMPPETVAPAWVQSGPDAVFETQFRDVRRFWGRIHAAFFAPLEQMIREMTSLSAVVPPALEDLGNHYVLRLEIADLDPNQIQLSARNQTLYIKAVRQNVQAGRSNTGAYLQSASYSSFSRTIPLPGDVDEANVGAAYEDGILTVTLPKEPVQAP